MAKAREAFRTISEVAEWLDTPTHVLRFWETKFSQIRPVKGAGGRRYYRPSDMDLLGGIKQLLHEDGLTIKGTQKLLRDKGAKYVATLGQSVTPETAEEVAPARAPESVAAPETHPEIAAAPAAPAPVVAPAPVMAPAPAAPPAQTALAFDDAPQPPRHPVFAAPPQELPDLPGRLIGRAPLHPGALQAQAARIAPLLARLEGLRARMHRA
ncbi:MerR family transcriptional regulator [Yoonia vestfoldensis]|uniref:MerR HTH family regulatory protein n=1 Tax=Yoonia vestfoldensis TaxID=245188 RepID=A0A1Y0EC23_9RHOB|nr:MerR family transcriptional regulator [Yoonia vestfoldensis]ARU00960.1 MerR HTH family regulatory protein [Yoonia vestfoldensis]